MYLTDAAGRVRFLCFDLDSHGGDVTRDAATITQVLTAVGVPHVVCASGTSGSRHIWVALAEPVAHNRVLRVYDAIIALGCPSLDRSATNNVRTGAVRPPTSPHRNGTRSEVLHGSLTDLQHPVTTSADIEQLIQLLERKVRAVVQETAPEHRRTVALDERRESYLPGRKRALPARIEHLLDAIPRDASATLHSILLAAAHAHWRLADIEALLPRRGLEHVRSRREGTSRTPRSPHEQRQVLTRQWQRAVDAAGTYRQSTASTDHEDNDEATVAAAITRVRHWMDSTPERWARRGGASDRLVLDALLLRMAQAVSLDIEGAQRSLAALTPLSHEAVGKALKRLLDDGPLARGALATGTRGHHWVLTPQKIEPLPSGKDTNALPYSQGFPRPPQGGTPLAEHLAVLQARTNAVTHDAFVGDERAIRAAMAWGLWVTERWRAERSPLYDLGVLHLGMTRPLNEVASQRETQGTLQRRRDRYQADQYAWRWWNAEVAYLRMTHAEKGRHLRQILKEQSQVNPMERLIFDRYPRIDARPDHARARDMIIKMLQAPPAVETSAAPAVSRSLPTWDQPLPASRLTSAMLSAAGITEPLVHIVWLLRRGHIPASDTLTVEAPSRLALPPRTVAVYTREAVQNGLLALAPRRETLLHKRNAERAERQSVTRRQRSA